MNFMKGIHTINEYHMIQYPSLLDVLKEKE